SSSGTATFSIAVSVGIRWYDWNTKPIVRRRKRASSVSPRRVTSTPSTAIEPPLGVSRPAMRPSSVDLPLPDGPVTATTSPAATSRLTPSRIVTGPPPLSRRITRSRTAIITRPYYTRRVRLPAAALLVVALLSAVPARAEEPVIVALGDSLTAGLGVTAEEAYPALL